MGTFKTMRLTVLFLMLLTLEALPAFVSSQSLSGDSLFRVQVKINDTIRNDSLYLLLTANGPLVEAKKFMDSIGGSFYPFSPAFHQYGFMVQYGKFISFTRLGYARGLYNCKLISMEPPATSRFIGNDSVYFAPLSFLAHAIDGTVTYDAIVGRLDITVSPPPGFGSVFPPAKDVALALQDSGYHVRQAGIYKSNPIDFCLGGYTPNANGNNGSFPYFCNLTPPSPYRDSLYDAPLTFNFGRDEAMVVIGKTPPECIYFSYRSYLYSRLFDFPPPGTRLKINASLGDTKSLYTMREDLPLDSMYQRKFALIMAADSLVAMHVKHTILAVTPEIHAADIYFDIIPHEMYRFGNDPQGDWGNFLHRVSLFSDTAAQNSYMNNPTLEIMRLTPVHPRPPVFFELPPFKARTCGTTEFSLVPDLELLEEKIYDTYQKRLPDHMASAQRIGS